MGGLLATRCASVWRTMCSQPAKASRPCYRCAASCRLADGRGAFGQPPCRHAASADAAPSLYRVRRRCGRRRGGDRSDRRADAAGIEAIAWSPRLGDFNEDLRTFGIDDLRAALRTQLAPQDVVRFCSGRRPRRAERRPVRCPRSLSGLAHDAGQSCAPGLLEGDRTAGGPARQWLRPAIFRRPWPPHATCRVETPAAGLCSANKIAGLRHPPLTLRPSASRRVQVRSARRLMIATKAAMGAADPPKGLYP